MSGYVSKGTTEIEKLKQTDGNCETNRRNQKRISAKKGDKLKSKKIQRKEK